MRFTSNRHGAGFCAWQQNNNMAYFASIYHIAATPGSFEEVRPSINIGLPSGRLRVVKQTLTVDMSCTHVYFSFDELLVELLVCIQFSLSRRRNATGTRSFVWSLFDDILRDIGKLIDMLMLVTVNTWQHVRQSISNRWERMPRMSRGSGKKRRRKDLKKRFIQEVINCINGGFVSVKNPIVNTSSRHGDKRKQTKAEPVPHQWCP